MTYHSISEKSDSHHPPSTYFIFQFQYTYTVVSKWLTCTPMKNDIINCSTTFLCIPMSLVYRSIVFIHFLNYLGRHLFPHTLPWCSAANLFPSGCLQLTLWLFSPWDETGSLEENSYPLPTPKLSLTRKKFQYCTPAKFFLPESRPLL